MGEHKEQLELSFGFFPTSALLGDLLGWLPGLWACWAGCRGYGAGPHLVQTALVLLSLAAVLQDQR